MVSQHLKIDVVVRRGAIDETRHRIQAAPSRCEAGHVLETDEPHLETTLRSAAKPFQLLPLVERGHADRWGWTDEQLAIMAASHTGTAYHRALVLGILSRLELGEERLACAFHEPLDPESRTHLHLHPEERTSIYNNCSGKHAGMLCLALSEGWPLEGYERAEHPLQQLMRRTVAEVAGIATERVSVAVDGCSASVFGLPLSHMARGFARLATAAPDGDSRDRALARIRVAMCAHPVAVGGSGRLSTALMSATGGRVVAKGGAEGLECIGIPSLRLGVAVKVEDGNDRAIGPAVIRVLEHLGALDPPEIEALAAWARPRIRDYAGTDVGDLDARVEVTAPA